MGDSLTTLRQMPTRRSATRLISAQPQSQTLTLRGSSTGSDHWRSSKLARLSRRLSGSQHNPMQKHKANDQKSASLQLQRLTWSSSPQILRPTCQDAFFPALTTTIKRRKSRSIFRPTRINDLLQTFRNSICLALLSWMKVSQARVSAR